MRKGRLLKNAAILTITSFILRTLGLFLRSYMAGKIKEEGMGLYQLIISIYILATTIVTAGISTAIIRLITEANANKEGLASVKKIMRKSFILSILISTIVSVIFFVLSKPISVFLLKDERCIIPIRILVLALPFISVSSAVKSFFVANRKVTLNSISQLIEQLVRIVLVFLFLELINIENIEKICMYIVISDIVSEIIACIFLYVFYIKEAKRVKEKKNYSFSIKYFFQIAFPITVNRYLSSTLRTIENILIPSKLTLYTLSREVSLAQFGALKGMALPLTFFPASFLTAISTLMVPETSEARALHQKNKISNMVERVFSFTLISGIIIAGIFYSYAEQIGKVFYPKNDISFYIKFLAPLIPFMYLESAITGIMQGLNQQRKALKYNVIDSIIRISLIYLVLPKYRNKRFFSCDVFK